MTCEATPKKCARFCHTTRARGRHPVREDVRGACEILGFDPLYVADEGRFVAFVRGSDAERAIDVLRRYDVCAGAHAIGLTDEAPAGLVTMRSRIGATRVVDMLSGEQLPRIC